MLISLCEIRKFRKKFLINTEDPKKNIKSFLESARTEGRTSSTKERAGTVKGEIKNPQKKRSITHPRLRIARPAAALLKCGKRSLALSKQMPCPTRCSLSRRGSNDISLIGKKEHREKIAFEETFVIDRTLIKTEVSKKTIGNSFDAPNQDILRRETPRGQNPCPRRISLGRCLLTQNHYRDSQPRHLSQPRQNATRSGV